jgi:hypothetical protein
MKPTKKAEKATSKSNNAKSEKQKGFTDEERAAMRERILEEKAVAKKADGESAVLAAIAKMPEPDRALGNWLHTIIKAHRTSPLAENLVRDARICQRRRCRLLLPSSK